MSPTRQSDVLYRVPSRQLLDVEPFNDLLLPWFDEIRGEAVQMLEVGITGFAEANRIRCQRFYHDPVVPWLPQSPCGIVDVAIGQSVMEGRPRFHQRVRDGPPHPCFVDISEHG